MEHGHTAGRRSHGAARWLTVLGALGAWSIVPPYLGPALGLELDVSSGVEFADHVIPGALVVTFSWLAVLGITRGARIADSLPVLGAIGVCLLAGVWETSSHVPLLAEAGDAGSPWGAVLLHATPGPAITALALWLMVRGR